MRMIGYIPSKLNASTFSDFLYVEGITNEVEQEKEGWAVWIHSEDELEKARALLNGYLANPADPKYRQQARQADELREREIEEQEEAARKTFDRSRTLESSVTHVAPVTFSLIGASILITILNSYGIGSTWLHALYFSEYRWGAPEILNGQIWRLFTPIFFHASLLSPLGFTHLLFDALWLYWLGTILESRRSTPWFLLFIAVIAAASNFGQYLWAGPLFGGLSGVVYGLLGYIWINGKFDPNAHMVISPQVLTMMLIWYFLCLFDLIPGMKVANAAHTVGLLGGMAWGFLSSLNSR